MLPSGMAGPFNIAMMELGGSVCAPRTPRCGECPFTGSCAAQASGRQVEFPARPARRDIPHYDVAAAVTWNLDESRFLVAQRLPKGLLGGLWEFPGGKQEPGETPQEALAREMREELGLEIRVGEPVCTVEHAYSHFRITLYAFHATVVSGEPHTIECAAYRWITLAEADDLAFSKADLRVLDALRMAAAAG
jgi:A/G-specific adenine glycosylase